MKLQTPVADERCKVGISYKDSIMMIGSCFTDNIGTQLKNYGFDVCVNPFGTLYNPASIHASVKRLLSGEPFREDDCMEIGAGDMRICSFSHHTSFARKSCGDFVADANKALEDAKAALEAVDASNKSELNNKIHETYTTLDAAIKTVQKNLDEVKAELAAKTEALEAKDKALQTFIIIVCVMSGVTLCGGGAFVTWFFIDRKKKF